MLLASGMISERDLEAARVHQRATGARLGATLIDLGFLDADDVARALARQHGVPAALTSHLRNRDRAQAERIPADLARNLHALPVGLSRGASGLNLVVCFRDPDPDIIAEVARSAGMPIIPAVACERLLTRELVLAYPSPAAARVNTPPLGSALPQHGSLRTTEAPPLPAPVGTSPTLAPATAPPQRDRIADDSYDVDLDDEEDSGFSALEQLNLVDLDDRRVTRDHSQTMQLPREGQSQRLPVARGTDNPETTARFAAVTSTTARLAAATTGAVPRIPEPTAASAGPTSPPAARVPAPPAPARPPTAPPAPRIAAPPAPARPPTAPPAPRIAVPAPPSTAGTVQGPRVAGAATPGPDLLRHGPRDPVAERFLPHLAASWRVAIVLTVDAGVITPRLGVGAGLTAAAFAALEISPTTPSMVRSVIEARRPHVGHAVDAAGAPREPWMAPMLDVGANELTIAPVLIGDRVVRVVVAIGARLEVGAAAGEVIRVASTMVDGYLRAAETRGP